MKISNIIFISFLLLLFVPSFVCAQVIGGAGSDECNLETVNNGVSFSDTLIYDSGPTSTSVDTSNLSSPPSITKTQFWVHGLGGTDDAWTQAISATQLGDGSSFPARNVDPNPIEYSSADMDAAVTSMINDMDNSDPEASSDNSYVIAHSQGGLVARYADQLWYNNQISTSRKYNGLATFGTAHLGAQVINNRNDVEAFLKEAARELTLGPYASLEQLPTIAGINLLD